MDATQHFCQKMSTELAEIKALPSNVVPVSKPSKIIKKLLDKRRKNHESCLKDFKINLQKINVEINEEIQLDAEIFKTCFEVNKKETSDYLKKVISISNSQLEMNYSNEDVEKMENKIFEFQEKQIELIDIFYKTLKKIEKRRANKAKKKFQDAYAKMRHIYYEFPNNLIKHFEERMLDFNQIILTNYRYYSEMYTSFKQQTENEVKLYLYELFKCREKQEIDLKKQKVKQSLVNITSQSAVNLTNNLLENFGKTPNLASTFPNANLQEWSMQVENNMQMLNKNSKKIVTCYKMAINDVFNRFTNGINNIKTAMQSESKTTDVDFVNREVYMPIINDITQQYAYEFNEIQNLWNNVITYMQGTLKMTSSYLENCVHLWNTHFSRIVDAQNLVLADLKQLISVHDVVTIGFDKKLYLYVDQLRESSTIPNLNNSLLAVKNVLNNIEATFHTQCDAEILCLNKYEPLITKQIELHVAELERFLGDSDSETMFKLDDNDDMYELFIPYEIKSCKHHIDAVKNWMFGLTEAIKLYMLTCHDEIKEEAKNWILKQADKVKKRHEIRMALHHPRMQRIKVLGHNERKNDLEKHQERYDLLETNISERVKNVKSRIVEFKENGIGLLDEYDENVEEFTKKWKSAKKSESIAFLVKQSNAAIKDVTEKIEALTKDIEISLHVHVNNSKKANYDFLASMTMFHQCGDFHHEEVKPFTKKIVALDTTIGKQFNPLFEEIHTYKSEIQEQLDSKYKLICTQLLQTKDELMFKENICKKLKELQLAIREKVYNLKFKFRTVEAYIDYFKELAEANDLGNKDQLDKFKISFDESVDKIRELAHYLTTHDDNSQELETNPSYLKTQFNMIKKSRQDIENVAKKFYEKYQKVLNRSKIQSSFQLFNLEINKLTSNYESQIYLNWIDYCQDLIDLILGLSLFLTNYNQHIVQKYIISKKELLEEMVAKKKEEFENFILKTIKDEIKECANKPTMDRTNDDIEKIKAKFNDLMMKEIEANELITKEEIELIKKNACQIQKTLFDMHRNEDMVDVINNLFHFIKRKLNEIKTKESHDGSNTTNSSTIIRKPESETLLEERITYFHDYMVTFSPVDDQKLTATEFMKKIFDEVNNAWKLAYLEFQNLKKSKM